MQVDASRRLGAQGRKGSIFSLISRSSTPPPERKLEVSIQLLDGRKMLVESDEKLTGHYLLRRIAFELGDAEKAKYLGLLAERSGEVPIWIDLSNPISKEIDDSCQRTLLLRIKFYPADPIKEMVPDTFARLLFYQLRHDLAVGRLLGKTEDQCALLAYAIKAEEDLDDVTATQIENGRLRKTRPMVPNFDKSMENEIKAVLIENINMTREAALNAFLKLATRMDTYGVEPFLGKDQHGNGICIGFNHRGLSFFKSSQRVNFFAWKSITVIDCYGKTLVMSVLLNGETRHIGFKCDSRNQALVLLYRLSEAASFYSTSGTTIKKKFSSGILKATKALAWSTESDPSTDGHKTPPCKITYLERTAFFRPALILSGNTADQNPTLPSANEVGETATNSPTPSEPNQPSHPAIVRPTINITPPDEDLPPLFIDVACSPFVENTLFSFLQSQGPRVSITDFRSSGSIASVCIKDFDGDQALAAEENADLQSQLSHQEIQSGEKEPKEHFFPKDPKMDRFVCEISNP
ncbi:hypothetical protein SprV_0200882500 [Sparganum proliferum]